MITKLRLNILCFFIIFVSILLTSCIANDDIKELTGQSEHWKASVCLVDNEESLCGNYNINVKYTYKGNLDSLKKLNKIVFAIGTERDNRIINLMDSSMINELKKSGKYMDEYKELYGISQFDFKNITSNTFSLKYSFQLNDKDDVIKAVQKDILIMIDWYTDTFDKGMHESISIIKQ